MGRRREDLSSEQEIVANGSAKWQPATPAGDFIAAALQCSPALAVIFSEYALISVAHANGHKDYAIIIGM